MGAPEDVLGRVRELLDGKGLLEKSGSVLYSSRETLTEGSIYFLGAHPGGDPDGPGYPTIGQDLDECLQCTDPQFNKYTHEHWGQGKGSAPLQLGVQDFFAKLGEPLEKVCCSNISFVRQESTQSRKESGAKLKKHWDEMARKCWSSHMAILRHVKPRLIITHHDWPRKFLLDKSVRGSKRSFRLSDSERARRVDYFQMQVGEEWGPVRILAVPYLTFRLGAQGEAILGELMQKVEGGG